MIEKDKAATTNEPFWDREVDRRVGCTVPFLDLDPVALRQFAAGQLDPVPDRLVGRWPCPMLLLSDVEGKDVLCLGAGGGQQSAVYGLLGARVTVVDLSERQLEGDRMAAAHYGYNVTTIHADMRDLSHVNSESFDIVYATGLCYIPDIRRVYSEVTRVLRLGGMLRMDARQPAVFELTSGDAGYRIAIPYCETINRRKDGTIKYRHYMDDVFCGLSDNGLSLLRVEDTGRHRKPPLDARPGSWTHEDPYVGGGFVILARKVQGSS